MHRSFRQMQSVSEVAGLSCFPQDPHHSRILPPGNIDIEHRQIKRSGSVVTRTLLESFGIADPLLTG